MNSNAMCTPDGGGGTPASPDGLICPAAFPCSASDLDIASIESGAQSIRKMKDKVEDRTNAIHATWKGLPEHYEAPEQEQVYQLMDKPKKAAGELADRMEKVAGYIDDYAGELSGLKSGLAEFEKRATAFESEARKGYEEPDTAMLMGAGPVPIAPPMKHVPWNEHGPAVKKNEDLLEEYAGYIEQISRAATTAAKKINALLRNVDAAPVEAITADMIMNSPDGMPWGAPVEEDRECHESVGHGVVNFGKNTVEGLGALIGRDPETGEWSWATAGQTWLGAGDFVFSTATATQWIVVSAVAPDGAVKDFANDRVSTVRGGWGGLIGWDEATHQAGGDGWGKFKEDPVAAITEGALNVGTFFIPGVGQAGGVVKGTATAARAGSMAGKGGKVARTVITITGHAADVVIPGGGYLVGKGAKLFNFGYPKSSNLNPISVADSPGAGGRPGSHTSGAGTPSSSSTPWSSSTRSVEPTGISSLPNVEDARPSGHGRSDAGAPSRVNPAAAADGSDGSGRSAGRASGAETPSAPPARGLDPSASGSAPDADGKRASGHPRSENETPAGGAAADTAEAVRGSEGDTPTGGTEKTSDSGHSPSSEHNAAAVPDASGAGARSGAQPSDAEAPSASETRGLDPSESGSLLDAENKHPDAHSRSENEAPDAGPADHADGPARGSEADSPARSSEGHVETGNSEADGLARGPEGDAPEELGSDADAPTGGGRYDPDAPVVETITQTELGRNPTAAERQQALDNAPWIEKDGKRVPVDHRTGRPLVLENAGGSSGWYAKPDADGQNWYAENPSKNPTQFEPTGEPGSYGYDMDGNLLKYAEYRPKHTLEQIIEVWNRARRRQSAMIARGQLPLDELGPNELWVRVLDDTVETSETGKIIDLGPGDGTSQARGKWRLVTWEPGQPREGVWDMGHLPDSQYAKEHQKYMSSGGEYTSEDFKRWYQNPDFYEPQDPSRNRSRIDDRG